MHKVADGIVSSVSIPIVHIVDVTAREIQNKGMKKVGLLGTRFTMEEDFYHSRLKQFGIETIIPGPEERTAVHEVIFNELIAGKINNDSRKKYVQIMEAMRKKGAEGIILGCTEIPLLIRENDVPVPLFDTTRIHSLAAVSKALDA